MLEWKEASRTTSDHRYVLDLEERSSIISLEASLLQLDTWIMHENVLGVQLLALRIEIDRGG
jgi:hypothetical protein